jgi:D-alanine-D-alanine ligase
VGKLNVLVLVDRWEPPEEPAAAGEQTPLTRTLDKKEVEDEVSEALGKLGHDATLHVLDGSTKGLHAIARIDCDLIFNLAESFGGNDTADYCIASYLELLDKRFTGSGSRGLLYGQDKAVAKKILEFHGIHTPVFARRTTWSFPSSSNLRVKMAPSGLSSTRWCRRSAS